MGPADDAATPVPGRYRADLSEGAAFLRRDRLLLSIAGMVAVTNLLDQAWAVVLLPVWASQHGYGAGGVAAVLSSLGAGALVGAVLASAYGHRLPRRWAYTICFLVAGAPRFLAVALGAPLLAVLAVTVLAGAFAGVINPVLSAVRIERVPRHLLGRVTALAGSMAWAGIPFGGPVAAVLLGLVDVRTAFALAGALYLATTLLPALLPDWAEMDRDRLTPHPPRPEDPAGAAPRPAPAPAPQQ